MVSVDYADLLAITLPYNRHHFKEAWVVTSHADEETQKVAGEHGAIIVQTDLFYRDGAWFNKFRALEHGLDLMGRDGWLTIMDADVLWPKEADLSGAREGCLYTPQRRMLTDLRKLKGGIPPEEAWSEFPYHHYQLEWSGYTQVFHAADPHLGTPPWHETNWKTAGGADSFFQAKWPPARKLRPPFEVLHLGPGGTNWAGRASPRVDGSLPEGAEERAALLRGLLRARRGPGPNRYGKEKL
jgi:hypothetical protein